MEPSHIVLVACAASKRREQSAARDLYVSTLFKEARRYAESVSDRWYILSALHMVLDPGRIIDPYEQTLNEMPIALRRQWADKVNDQLLAILPAGAKLTILAGKTYREFTEPMLRRSGFDVHIPLAHLGIGRQIQWLQQVNASSTQR